MEKIKISNLKTKGILERFLYSSDVVNAGDNIAVVKINNDEIIIKAPYNGKIIKPLKTGTTVKKGSTIAYLLTDEKEIAKYNNKHGYQDEFSYLDKDGVRFNPGKNGQFGTKWKDIEEEDYSGAAFVSDVDTKTPPQPLNITETPSENNQYANRIANLKTIVESPEAPITEEPKAVLLESDDLTEPSVIPVENNQPIINLHHPIKEQTDNLIKKEEPVANSNSEKISEKHLTFGPQKSRRLSFKNLHYNVGPQERAQIPSIDTIKDVNVENYGVKDRNDNVKNNHSLNNSFMQMHSDIANAVKESDNMLKDETNAKTYAKYLVEETKVQDQAPQNNSTTNLFAANEEGNSSFRDLVKARRNQLHQQNNFHEIINEPENNKNAMDFLDEYGRPKIMRNIIQGRMNNLMKNNGQLESIDGVNSTGASSSDHSVAKQPKISVEEEPVDYITADGYEIKVGEDQNTPPKDLGYYSPLKTYRDRLYEKLNNNDQREKILKTRNQRELIKKRMEQLARGDIEVTDNVLGAINNYKRPSYEEIEAQYDLLNDNYNKQKLSSSTQAINNNEEVIDPYRGIIPDSRKSPSQPPSSLAPQPVANSQPFVTNPAPQTQPVIVNQPPVINNSNQEVLVELAILKEKLAQQEQQNKHHELLQEIKTLKENNLRNNVNNNDHNNFDKMMQYMLMQQMIKSMNQPPDPFLTQLLRESMSNQQATNFNQLSPEPQNQPVVHNNEGIMVKKFDEQSNSNAGNFIQPLNNNLNILHTNTNPVEPQGLETREEIKRTKYPVIRSVILSQSQVPPLTISTEIDMSAVIEQQRKLKNANAETGVKFSTMSFILKAVSLALSEYPKLNSYYDQSTNQIVIKNSHHIGLATETSEGLVIPVIKFAERLSLKQIAINIQETLDRLRQGELYDYELQGSTITIANYGTVGATQATPTIFYPNSAVIGIGRIVRKPIVIKGDKLVIRSMMSISLTIDQRIIDAAEAGIFMTRLKEILEQPELITLS
ncbi:2-oxo acid dehydrogenase subunit E2 [Spiroplasma eriocheiris]|uniref:2-oxoacid dehydrogenase acyltransferase catalytic domain-containing protein n=1 Tax=Spiroplasma eriocheiris TaxID=315358 RepID=A0A0H3XHF9_9MOLU|nr:2-oxo acid dehydrogenase subunit E2 [Spiroplasma eriocheiris]AHF57229.1 hypothetical protein SPE_0093 [Spiroplasma eriocheiris CCTCC M 207170]AKM53695.1 hypothetical protein SERIO_v1c00930 [Spiroplasma eriocheiris]